MLFVMVAAFAGAGGCEQRDARVADGSGLGAALGVRPESLFALELGTPLEDVRARLGANAGELGSGVTILRYELSPNGYALVFFGPDNTVSRVGVVWSCGTRAADEPGTDLSSWIQRESAVARWEQQFVPADPKPSAEFVAVRPGTSRADVERRFGPPAALSVGEPGGWSYALEPHGRAIVAFGLDGTVASVLVTWWRAAE